MNDLEFDQDSDIKEQFDYVIQKQENPICNFWIRILSAAIDGIIVTIPANVFAFIFRFQLSKMGGWERLVGFAIVLTYYGILNSYLTKGQTIGKKITRIRVVDQNGKNISIRKSLLRVAILTIPFFLNGAKIPASILVSPLGIIVNLLLFGGGISIAYFYIFNKATRQSLHDIICKTYVVRASINCEEKLKPIAKIHYIIVGVIIICIFVVSILMLTIVPKRAEFSQLISLQKQLSEIHNIYYAGVFVGKTFGPEREKQYVKAIVYWRGEFHSPEVAERKVARVILDNYPNIEEKDYIAIFVIYGYDIGLCQFTWTRKNWLSPQQWREQLNLTK